MTRHVLRFLTTLLAGLFAGALWLDWLVSSAISGPVAYIALKQAEIPPLTALLPPSGVLLTVLVLAEAALDRRTPARLWLLLLAAACLIAIGILTASVFLPMNGAIMSWHADAPPADWSALRERWNQAQSLRAALAMVTFVVLNLVHTLSAGSHRPAEAAIAAPQQRAA